MKVLSEYTVKTRQPHICWGCVRPISVGSVVTRTASVDEGSVGTSYWCNVCWTFMRTLHAERGEEGWYEGELLNEDGHPLAEKGLDHDILYA